MLRKGVLNTEMSVKFSAVRNGGDNSSALCKVVKRRKRRKLAIKIPKNDCAQGSEEQKQPIFVWSCRFCEREFQSTEDMNEHMISHFGSNIRRTSLRNEESRFRNRKKNDVITLKSESGEESDEKQLDGPKMSALNYCSATITTKSPIKSTKSKLRSEESPSRKTSKTAKPRGKKVKRNLKKPASKKNTRSAETGESRPEESTADVETESMNNESDENKHSTQERTNTKTKSQRDWTCKTCLQTFPSSRLLKRHRAEHNRKYRLKLSWNFDETDNTYTCTVCSSKFQQESEVEKHIEEVHVNQFFCLQCDNKFPSAYTFANHMREHNQEQVYRCPMCPYENMRGSGLYAHVVKAHYNRNAKYHCETCGKGFSNFKICEEHNNEHLGIKPFVCVVCNKSFFYSAYLRHHQVGHHTVGIEGQRHPKQCHLCLRMFAKIESKEKHMLDKHNNAEKPHLCDECGKSFQGKWRLVEHMRIHTGERPFACTECDKRFRKKTALVEHFRIHTGEKPFACKYCGKAFNQRAPLKIHMRSHTGERPYTCEFCNSGFASRTALNSHKNKVCVG